MKRFLTLFSALVVAATLALSGPCFADGLDLATKNTKNFQTFSGAPASGDVTVIFDASDDKWKTQAAELAGNGGQTILTICGDATTVNNNTVYYGPDSTLYFSSTSKKFALGDGLGCDIDAAGSTTEATADAPVFQSTGLYVKGMTCRNEGDANADISYTLRTAAGATSPSVTCTISDGYRNCVADGGDAPIAANSTVAVAVASTSNVGSNNGFVCTINAAY